MEKEKKSLFLETTIKKIRSRIGRIAIFVKDVDKVVVLEYNSPDFHLPGHEHLHTHGTCRLFLPAS